MTGKDAELKAQNVKCGEILSQPVSLFCCVMFSCEGRSSQSEVEAFSLRKVCLVRVTAMERYKDTAGKKECGERKRAGKEGGPGTKMYVNALNVSLSQQQ